MTTSSRFGLACLGAMALALGSGLLSHPATAADAPVRVLIFSGQNNHDWRTTTPKLKAILLASGRFTVDVTERPDQCTAESLSHYDVVLGNWNAWGNAKDKEWQPPMREAFLDFVRRGGGHVVVHAGSSSFLDWPDYQKLVGGTWGAKTGHGAIHTFEVKAADPAHPITRGLAAFKTTDELWHRTATQSNIHVLATAFSAKDKGGSGDDEPVAFVSDFGKGRCFNLVLGHDTRAMDALGFQALLLRGTEWAATAKVTLSGPSVLPAASEVDGALKAAAAYRFGDSRLALRAVENMVQAASTDPAAQRQLAPKLAAVLASDATVEARQFCCAQLSLIASADEVPALARLLGDKDLGYYARQALERIPGEASLAALQAALATTAGRTRVEIIHSLAVRRADISVADIAKLIQDADPETAGAALQALGDIGGASAANALLAAEARVAPTLKPILYTALLRCAEQGSDTYATPILRKLTEPGQLPQIRLAAFPLYASALGEQGADLVLAALGGDDKSMQAAAIRALRTTRSAALVQASARRLDQLSPTLQAPIIVLLGERGDAAALPAVTQALASKDSAVKRAALGAVGSVGNASTVPALAQLLGAADAEETKLIDSALIRLRGEGVDAALIAELKKSVPAGQRELLRVLAARGAKAAIPAMLETVAGNDATLRREAIAGLEKVGDASACGPLVRLLDPAAQTAPIESALSVICRREGTVEALVAALPQAAPAKQALLLGVLGTVGSPAALEAVRTAAKSENPDIRTAAVRALADWPDAAPLDDLVALSLSAPEPKLKTLAVRGVAKMVPLAKDRSADQLTALLQRALAGAEVNEQKALLGALGDQPTVAAMKAAAAQLANPALTDEASLAILKIVDAIGQDHRAEAKAAVEQVVAACKNPAIAEQAATASLKFGELQNLSLGAKASSPDGLEADGQAGGDQAAIDGNPATYWDELDNQKLYILKVQLQQRSKVAFLRILGWKQHQYAPRDFEVRCDDKVVKKIDNAQYKNNWLTVDLPVTECASVELRITGYYTGSPAIRELEIYGKTLK